LKLKELGWNDLAIQQHVKDDLTFTSKVGTAICPDNFIRNFKSLLKTAKLPVIRFHDLRHTFATISLQKGIDPKSLQSDLGHESIETTLDRYGHVNMEMKRSAAKKRTGIFSI